jgi:hypothetical protein
MRIPWLEMKPSVPLTAREYVVYLILLMVFVFIEM